MKLTESGETLVEQIARKVIERFEIEGVVHPADESKTSKWLRSSLAASLRDIAQQAFPEEKMPFLGYGMYQAGAQDQKKLANLLLLSVADTIELNGR